MVSTDTQNVWFGISMGLMGLIVGFFIATMMNAPATYGSQPVAQVPPPPNAPVDAPPAADPRFDFPAIVADIGLDVTEFQACVDSGKHTQFINDQMAAGQKSGVTGTPGNIVYNVKTKKGILIPGARDFASFKTDIDAMIAGTPSTAQAATDVTPIDKARDHIRGNANAEIAIIEYSDFECPFCQRVHPTYKQIMDEYGDKVMWVYRHFPLSFHPKAMPAALASECVFDQGGNEAFWKFADKAFGEA